MQAFRGSARGFTLIELMLVVAIIGLLAAIALPKFGNLIIKSKEAAVRGQLGGLRSAISIYYSDNEGIFPRHNGVFMGLPGLTVGYKYLNAIPRISIPTQMAHVTTDQVCTHILGDWNCPGGGPGDMAWGYSNASGLVGVACTHPDSRGVVWSTQ